MKKGGRSADYWVPIWDIPVDYNDRYKKGKNVKAKSNGKIRPKDYFDAFEHMQKTLELIWKKKDQIVKIVHFLNTYKKFKPTSDSGIIMSYTLSFL